MPASDVDHYLAGLPAPDRAALQTLRRMILDVVPDAEEGLSYGAPAFKVRGKAVAGFAAFKDHLSYLPHSGSVLGELAGEVSAYRTTKGSLHFSPDGPLPPELVASLISARLRELGLA
ncbi:MAG TPA: DUF1801 domain-containing protein [Nocardioidaceae bacterium]|nr:DUF1801 domain-containing protein [Nocardioidaceae bacterium]